MRHLHRRRPVVRESAAPMASGVASATELAVIGPPPRERYDTIAARPWTIAAALADSTSDYTHYYGADFDNPIADDRYGLAEIEVSVHRHRGISKFWKLDDRDAFLLEFLHAYAVFDERRRLAPGR